MIVPTVALGMVVVPLSEYVDRSGHVAVQMAVRFWRTVPNESRRSSARSSKPRRTRRSCSKSLPCRFETAALATLREREREHTTLRGPRMSCPRARSSSCLSAPSSSLIFTRKTSEEWTRVLKDALGDIGSAAAPSLRGFFGPASSSEASQVAVVAPRSSSHRGYLLPRIEYTQAAWRVAYSCCCTASGARSSRVRRGQAARGARDRAEPLDVAPLLFRRAPSDGRDGRGSWAWARNNSNATKIDLDGLTSLTGDGIAEVIKMLPRLQP